MAGSDYERCEKCEGKAFYAGADLDIQDCVVFHQECLPSLHTEEVWQSGPQSLPLPDAVITSEGVFHADGVTPLVINDDRMRAGGWRKMRRLVTEWEEVHD